MNVSENYQNKSSLNKDCITAKLTSIRTGFKKAADVGKKSGGGRVVFTIYDLCVNLWGGSPAVTIHMEWIRLAKTTTMNQEEMSHNLQLIFCKPRPI